MKIAVPSWCGRVSPVLDVAERLLVVEAVDGREVARRELSMSGTALRGRVDAMATGGVDVLICGALSAGLATICQAAGIRLLAWVTGPVDEVLRAYLAGELPSARFTMPGCGGSRRRRCRGGGRARRRNR